MGIFDNILYPDNEKRERRVNELQDDIKLYVYNIVEKGEMINSLFESLKQKLDSIGDELRFPELKEEITIPIYQEYNFSISKIIKYVLDIEVFSKVTNHANKFILMKRKGVRIPFDNFGFSYSWTPKVFERIQTISLGLGGGFGLFDLMIGAIWGAECLQPRIELKYDVMVLDLLIFEFQGFIGELEYIKIRKLTREELYEIFKLLEQRSVEKVKEINYNKVEEILKQMDEQRDLILDIHSNMMEENKEIIYENDSEYVDTEIKKFVLEGGLENNPDVETKMGVFEPLFYPDNQNRLQRVNELANDIRTFSVELIDKKDKLDFELERLKEILEKIGDDLEFFKLKEEIKIPIYKEYDFTVPLVIKYIIESLIVIKASNLAYKFALMKNFEHIRIPFTSFKFKFRWAPHIFGLAVGGVIGVALDFGIDLILDSIFGAMTRDRLQSYIKDCREPHIELYYNKMVFELVTDEIKALVNGLDYVRTRNPTKKEIENMLEEIKIRCDEKIKEIDDGNKVCEALEKLDKGRESWVVEG
ncbi:2782_t:CDS:2 [Dentiscutata heterogama]|uniref:2782_t:CDS:1 n=1 Tax=Dentiscutata heterogama TaxID=1316150 RepID=A0ACA9LAA7_9GLOM|nr:2782_t:CDS:2 [Dentiscutata heterogama]